MTTDAGIALICNNLGALRHLSLARLLNITDAALAEIAAKTELCHLNVTFCHLLSADAKSEFKRAHPECEFVDADD
jgi:hypothetical protein